MLTDGLLNVCLEGLGLGELAFHMSGKPYLSQWPSPRENGFRVELKARYECAMPDRAGERTMIARWGKRNAVKRETTLPSIATNH
jgi:hypothetical protein